MSNMPDFESRRSAIIAEITAAFDGVSREDGTTLHEAEAKDDYKLAEDQHQARLLDLETRWQDVSDSDIFACCSALSFMNEKGFRYYIPAFMIYSLKHWGDDWNMILNSCEYHLLHDYPKSLRKSEPAAIAGKYHFTDVQSKAVAKFLRFIIDFDEATADKATVEAVEKWERFCMATIIQEDFTDNFFALLKETFESSPPGQGSYYLDAGAGLFETLDKLTAEQASHSATNGAPTIAAHCEHVRFYLMALLRLMDGATEKVDWKQSWLLQTVDAAGWDALRKELRQAYMTVNERFGAVESWGEAPVSHGMAIPVHTAYHLGAIRQLARALP